MIKLKKQTPLTSLNAVSPIDGRYRGKTESLSAYFSEAALIKYRIFVEIEYFIALCKIPLPQLEKFDSKRFGELRKIYLHFTEEDAQKVKDIEKETNHDVKAVEYFIKNKFEDIRLSEFKEFIHFGLTSQDINNTAIPLSIKEAIEKVYTPACISILEQLKSMAIRWKDIPMLAKTHGQPASPTKLGKEIEVFAVRLQEQYNFLKNIPNAAKFGGATGNFNAHKVAYPNINWKDFGNQFVEKILGLKYSFPTTQIEHYDHMAALYDGLKRINTIIIDMNRDMWTYISMGYFVQKIKKEEVGSSAMPHKINPIDFENSEGNLGIANAIFEHLAAKLPISRLQRDLTDSTVLRNVGVPIGHTIVGFAASLKGLHKLRLNQKVLELDLEQNWAVVAEAIQTILRREGYPNPYETLKKLTRTEQIIDKKRITKFIDTLKLPDAVKTELKQITPSNYTGI